jgi:hypothetical protein
MRRILLSIVLLCLAGCACHDPHFSGDGTMLNVPGATGMAAPVVAQPVSDCPCKH